MISKDGLKKGPQTELSRDQGSFLGSAHLLHADCTWQLPMAIATAGCECQAFRGSLPTDLHELQTRLPPAKLSGAAQHEPVQFQPQCPTPRRSFQEPAWSHVHSLLVPHMRMPSPICTPGHTHPQVTCNPLWALITGRSRILTATSLTTKSTPGRELLGQGCTLYWWTELPAAKTRRGNAGCRPSMDSD